MIRFGLCCLFINEPVRFRTFTATSVLKIKKRERIRKISGICLENCENLQLALSAVNRMGIGAFRICSGLFPVYTHPDAGYLLDELPDSGKIRETLIGCRKFAAGKNIRLSFHPDQFIVLSSPHENVVANSAKDLECHGMLAELLDAGVINIHLGGRYGSKKDAIERFRRNFEKLSDKVRSRITLENDDVSYTPEDLYPICSELEVPLVYDVHHHRCNPDGSSVKDASELCIETWKTRKAEPYFHISSPKNGWNQKNIRSHSDYINPEDFPECWLNLKTDFTLDVEAKSKELAVLKLMSL
ncbi:MAG: UV DNA damage repair endonuclease UvsE [Lentisphaerae bacterium]|nr:UV DNA damage repair endonuclease UvsE [Lentisphaerota bacterium]